MDKTRNVIYFQVPLGSEVSSLWSFRDCPDAHGLFLSHLTLRRAIVCTFLNFLNEVNTKDKEPMFAQHRQSI